MKMLHAFKEGEIRHTVFYHLPSIAAYGSKLMSVARDSVSK